MQQHAEPGETLRRAGSGNQQIPEWETVAGNPRTSGRMEAVELLRSKECVWEANFGIHQKRAMEAVMRGQMPFIIPLGQSSGRSFAKLKT